MQGRREDMKALQNIPCYKNKTLTGKSKLEEHFGVFNFTPEFSA